MSNIHFWYPAKRNCDDTNPVRKSGIIQVINIHHEPYEINICANGYDFHVIFGNWKNGHFLSIPNWGVGCDLAPCKDRFWNTESISKSKLISYEDACAVANALDLISIMLGK